MQRLAELEHYIVGDVHHRVNTADIGATQPLDHPQWRRSRQVNVTNYAPEVARTSFRREHLYGAHLIMARGHGSDFDDSYCCVIHRANFACKPSD